MSKGKRVRNRALFEKSLNAIATIIEEQLASLPPKKAKAMRKELHDLAERLPRPKKGRRK
jgi:hypothetical protein